MIKREITFIIEDYFEDEEGNPETEEQFLASLRDVLDMDTIPDAHIIEFSVKDICESCNYGDTK